MSESGFSEVLSAHRILSDDGEDSFFSRGNSTEEVNNGAEQGKKILYTGNYELGDLKLEKVYEFIYKKNCRYVCRAHSITKDCLAYIEKNKEFKCVASDIFVNTKEEYEGDTYFYEYKDERYSGLLKVTVRRADAVYVSVASEDQDSCKVISKKFLQFARPEKPHQIGLLGASSGGVYVQQIDFHQPDMDIELNYGLEFMPVYNKIINKLSENRQGLYLFHGLPGTGKTTFIKHVCSKIRQRQFIFVPTTMIGALTGPQLISTLIGNKDCVLVLEDCEKAIVSRESDHGDASLVSTILNLSDGILGTLLSTAVIVTFNTKREDIDKALLRKGRLIIEHKFDNLSIDSSNKLLKHLGKKYEAKEKMSLADIYNVDDDNFHKEEVKGTFGFGK